MECATNVHQEVEARLDALKLVEYMSDITNVIDHTDTRHKIRKFLLLGCWGFCDADATQILVEAKKHYSVAKILIRYECLIVGDQSVGWDVYSLVGEQLESFPPMALEQAIELLEEKKKRAQ